MPKKMRELAARERNIERMFAKARGTIPSGQGATPAPYDPIPDYADIYYQPDDDPRREDERTHSVNRRRAMGVANRGKYGFHGTADPEDTPILRYEEDDFHERTREQQGDERMATHPITPNRYPQPTSEDVDEEDDDGDAPVNDVRKKKQRFIVPKKKARMRARMES